MATLRNQYSGLITKGLGLPACNGMITMGFSLFVITITPNVQKPPSNIGGSGGGWFAVPENPYYIPMGDAKIFTRSAVDISIKFPGTKTWRFSTFITNDQAKHVVKVINITNKATKNMKVAVKNLKERVISMFEDDDE